MKTLLQKVISGNYRTKAPDIKYVLNYYLPRAVAVDINNVAEWSRAEEAKYKNEAMFLEYISSISPQRLPFESIWMEFNQELEHDDHSDNAKIGALLMDVEDDSPEWKYQPGVFCFFFLETHGTVTFVNGLEFQSIDGGRTISRVAIMTPFGEMYEEFKFPILYIISALVFFSCKNTTLIKEKKHSTKSMKKFEEESGRRIQDFHVIEIHKFMEKSEPGSGKKSGPSVSTSHLVRGHFKRFGKEKKLLGKFEGTYFWHPHVRGSIGPIIVHDYRVWPPQDRHKKSCVLKEVPSE